MFESKKLILYITKSKITLTRVTIGKIPKEEILVQLEWTPSTLDNVLLRIKNMAKGKVKILLGEDFVYETLVSLPKGSQITKDAVQQKAQELIPENLNKTVWSFKEISTKIQITAIVWSLFEQISKSIAKTGIQVDEIEPLSYALARFTKGFEKPFLFVYLEDKAYLILAQKELVLATERLENPNLNAINQFVAFTKDSLNVDIKDVIFCGNSKNIDLSNYQNANFRIEIQDINPVISFAEKEVFQESRSMLSLQLLKVIHKETENIRQTQKTTIPKKRFSYPIATAIGFIVVIGIAGVLTKNVQDNAKHNSLPTPTIVLSPTMKPASPSALNKLDYTIVVLNGSGIGGEATKIKELLENAGFNVIGIGNAENSNYEKTVAYFKETVPLELILPLDKLLKSVYDFSTGTKLKENSESDVLIIIGKK